MMAAPYDTDTTIDDDSSASDLHLACRRGDLDRVKYLIASKRNGVVDLNAIDDHDSSPLYYAALCGHQKVVQYLLDCGAHCPADDSARIYYAALSDDLRSMLRTYRLGKAATDGFLEALKNTYHQEECFADWELVVPSNNTGDNNVLVVPLHSALVCVRCPLLAAQMLSSSASTSATSGSNGKRRRFLLNCVTTATATAGRSNNHKDLANVILLLVEYLYTGLIDISFDETQAAEETIRIARWLGLKELFFDLKRKCETRTTCERKRLTVDHRERLRSDMCLLAGSIVRPNEDSGRRRRHQQRSIIASWIRRSSDAVLCAENGERFHIHRFLTVAQSEYFRKAFMGSFQEATSGVVALPASREAVAAACEWMYSDQWKDTPEPELCLELIDLASHLMLPRMSALAATFLAPQIVDTMNAFDVLSISRIYQLEKLETSCLRVIALRIEQVVQSEEGRERLIEVIREEVSGTAQSGDVNVSDVPLVADMKKLVKDHFEYLGEDDVDSGQAVATTVDVDDSLQGVRSLRQERRYKLNLLDRLVQEALRNDDPYNSI